MLGRKIKKLKDYWQGRRDLTVYRRQLAEFHNRPATEKFLFVTHELTASGAPLMLLSAAKAVKKNGGEVLLLAYEKGVLESSFTALDIPVFCHKGFRFNSKLLKEFSAGFDKVVANTVVSYTAVGFLAGQLPVLWWIHEGKNLDYDYIRILGPKKTKPRFMEVLKKAEDIAVVSEYAAEVVKKYNPHVRIVMPGEKDQAPEALTYSSGDDLKVKFLLAGTICERKAQDVLVEAVKNLTPAERKQCEFHILGGLKGDFYQNLKQKSAPYPEIIWHDLITDQTAKWAFFNQTDVMLVISRDESFGLMVLEGSMLGKVIVVSENVGAKQMVEDEKSGFVVKTGDAVDLVRVIRRILNKRSQLSEMGRCAREKYLQYGTEEHFNRRFLELLQTENPSSF